MDAAPPFRVREATPFDAVAAADLVRRSIAGLCAEDWRGDRAVLKRWLADKTARHFRRWMADPGRTVFVAERADGRLCAVGMVSHAGLIELNYVAPEARFAGASKALVRRMEAHLAGLGHGRAALGSTHTARAFYAALGYAESGWLESRFGTLPVIQMSREFDI